MYNVQVLNVIKSRQTSVEFSAPRQPTWQMYSNETRLAKLTAMQS